VTQTQLAAKRILHKVNRRNAILTVRHELRDTINNDHSDQNNFRFRLFKMQAEVTDVTSVDLSGIPDYELVKPPLSSAVESPAHPHPPGARCRRAGIDTRTVDYEARRGGGTRIMTAVMTTMRELPMMVRHWNAVSKAMKLVHESEKE
jgi:hypothetical protein